VEMKFEIIKNGVKETIDLPDCKDKLNWILGNKIFSVNTVPNIAITKDDRIRLLEEIQGLAMCFGEQLWALKREYEG
jgi:hypothetical protein